MSEQSNVVQLRDGVTSPRLGYTALIEPPSKFGSAHLTELKPERLSAILREAQGGKLETWNDLCDKMLETDSHLRSVYETRISAVTGAKWEVVPGRAKPGQEQLAIAAAKFCRDAMNEVEDLEQLFANLLDGTFRGIAGLEHDWYRVGSAWLSAPFMVPPKLFRYSEAWTIQVRNGPSTWVDLPDGKFLVYVPRGMGSVPTRTALLRACAWYWLFKFWGESFWTQGAERSGNPPVKGRVPANSPREVKQRMLQALEKLSADQAAVVEEGTDIEFMDTFFASSSAVWKDLGEYCCAQISKAVLGSTLNVEVGDTGGAYALGVSQAASTIRPRARKDAKGLGGTIKRDWFTPLLRYNNHLFNGIIPPAPDFKFPEYEEEQPADIPPHIFQANYESGNLRRNELRRLAHLDPLPQGGEEFVTPAPKLPAFSRGEVPQLPLARSGYARVMDPRHPNPVKTSFEIVDTSKLPADHPFRSLSNTTTITTSPTSSGSPTSPLAHALEALSDDP